MKEELKALKKKKEDLLKENLELKERIIILEKKNVIEEPKYKKFFNGLNEKELSSLIKLNLDLFLLIKEKIKWCF